MTATQPSGSVGQPGGAAGLLAAAVKWLRSRLAGNTTPSLLRLAMVVTTALTVLFGVFGALGVSRREAALADARVAAEQLLAVQELRVNLVHADALASEAYLAGGEASGSLRTEYEAEIAAVGVGVAAVSNGSSPAVASALGEVAQQVARYAGLVEQAQANNRQGFPVGAAFLRQANTVVTKESVPLFTGLEQTLRGQVNSALDRASRAGAWLPLFGAAALAGLAVIGAWLSVRFRRLLNIPLALASGVVAVLLIVGYSMQADAITTAQDATAGPLTLADSAAQVRAAEFAARREETAVLIYRGNNQAQRDAFALAINTAAAAVRCPATECPVQAGVTRYRAAAESVIELSERDGDAAREASLNSSSADFRAAADAAGQETTEQGAAASAAFADSADGLGTLRVVVFAGALVAAALALAGLGQRLKEYR